MQLEWSQFARSDREAIFDYIEADSAQAAISVDDRIRQQIEELMKFPKIGRLERIDGTRELIIQRTPYIAVYRIAGKTIRILRVLHGAQMWPQELP